jgi:Oxidoreductase molybdopterin binding domain
MIMKRIRRSRAIGLATILALGILGLEVVAQSPSKSKTGSPPKAAQGKSEPILEIAGEVKSPYCTLPGMHGLPRRTVQAKGHDGVESRYEGVPLIELLAMAGVPTGSELRGKALALFVVVEASDGYRAVFALAELDSGFTDRVILVADRRDDKPLSAQSGPFQLVVPGEKKHARWVRQVIRIKVGRG